MSLFLYSNAANDNVAERRTNRESLYAEVIRAQLKWRELPKGIIIFQLNLMNSFIIKHN